MEGKFIGREIIQKPLCPFCGRLIEKPEEIITSLPNEMPLGACECGAVYSCDVTGHNLGTAMIEALVYACGGDYDLAWNLLPEDDYIESRLEHYDYETHFIVHAGAFRGRRIAGTLYFIRLYDHVRETARKSVSKHTRQPRTPVPESTARTTKRKKFSKRDVEKFVKSYDLGSILALAEQGTRIIPDLKRLLYSADDLLRYRAAEALGRVSALIAAKNPGAISRLLQGLFISITDTAASSWGALDAIGEIIGHCPEEFSLSEYIPQLYALTRDRTFLVNILRALGRISEKKPQLIRKETFQFFPLLYHSDPEVRAYTLILLANLEAREVREEVESLVKDHSAIVIYQNGQLENTSVSDLASYCLEKIQSRSAI
ncbi:MAG: HEAT repeat domain-containing protein [Deltaproteobacteria bacterium]|nr:HEAT repeat domain-containing protein [Deltaproteobacteria bacterium]MBW1921398.1 HEAT repeat domain-containing protein [Deltaproteobacteria bacterium]MBW1977714.1 HEAT repeat domain-containing protein [Deltaproteobacteria bacterium]MBW2043428.1 HEAT repeat domain-containing protein [Deltaproteobacteria bacterium]MBW2299452.1 HEAT repeat domain-containing protein [Deltaproteobacteria bacterium]